MPTATPAGPASARQLPQMEGGDPLECRIALARVETARRQTAACGRTAPRACLLAVVCGQGPPYSQHLPPQLLP